MPVRSLGSAVLKWPGREVVLDSARRWAVELRANDPKVVQMLCVGSCARGDYGVGSDLDLIVIVEAAPDSPVDRRRRYEPTAFPVPVDVTVLTRTEWSAFAEKSPLLWQRLQREMIEL